MKEQIYRTYQFEDDDVRNLLATRHERFALLHGINLPMMQFSTAHLPILRKLVRELEVIQNEEEQHGKD